MAELRERRLLTRRELPVLAGLALGALGLLLWLRMSPAGRTAVVEVDGQPVLRRELAALGEAERLTFTGQEGVAVTVELTQEGARVADAGCPDKTCVRTGHLTRAGQSAVCLPGRVVLRLEGPGAADAETY